MIARCQMCGEPGMPGAQCARCPCAYPIPNADGSYAAPVGKPDRETWAEQRERAERLAVELEYQRDRATVAALLERIDALEAENAERQTWNGLMRTLNEHYPEDIFPHSFVDNPKRDPLPRIVSLVRSLDAARAVVEAAREMGAAHATTPAEAMQALARGAANVSAALARFDDAVKGSR